jgi:hypothetical protein
MRHFLLLSAVVAVLLAGALTEAQAQPQNAQQGLTYIYPNGTVGYYVGNNYRSGYYVVPPINRGFYGPPAYPGPQRRSYYSSQLYDYRTGQYMNYPGFYYQPNHGVGQ